MQKGLSTMRRVKMGAVKMGRMKLWVAVLLLSSLLAGCAAAQIGGAANAKASLAFARAERLKRGINTSEWFAQVYDKRGYTPEHFQAWTTAEDIALIKSMGFDHVRLRWNPQPMFTTNQPQKIPTEYLGYLDAAVKMILDHGLVVVIDMHPERVFEQRLAEDDSLVEQFAVFWRA